MALRIGDLAPNFQQESTEGNIDFNAWQGKNWVVLFSHPRDFTPVCTTELGEVARLKPEFEKRHVKAIGLSVDPLKDHQVWSADIKETQGCELNFPLLADADRKVAKLYDMIHPNSDDTFTVRSVFVIDPNRKIRLILTYPASTGRNFVEILRVIDSLQLTDSKKVATPVNWRFGDDVIIVPSLKDETEMKTLFPLGWKTVKPYLRTTPQPTSGGQLIKINGKNFLDMSHLASEATLAELDREINFGLARSKSNFLTPGNELSIGIADLSVYDHQFKDVGIAESELTPDEIAELKTMAYSERQRYLKYAKGAYFPWAIYNSLLTGSTWNEKASSEGKVIYEEAQQLFPKLINWCYALPIFKSIGRIGIFGVDPRQHVTCHRDADPAKWGLNDESLMVCPRGDKKFYLYDPETREKFKPPSKIYIFHDQNYHGVDPAPNFTYSFRIDGFYTDEFRKTISIKR